MQWWLGIDGGAAVGGAAYCSHVWDVATIFGYSRCADFIACSCSAHFHLSPSTTPRALIPVDERAKRDPASNHPPPVPPPHTHTRAPIPTDKPTGTSSRSQCCEVASFTYRQVWPHACGLHGELKQTCSELCMGIPPSPTALDISVCLIMAWQSPVVVVSSGFPGSRTD